MASNIQESLGGDQRQKTIILTRAGRSEISGDFRSEQCVGGACTSVLRKDGTMTINGTRISLSSLKSGRNAVGAFTVTLVGSTVTIEDGGHMPGVGSVSKVNGRGNRNFQA